MTPPAAPTLHERIVSEVRDKIVRGLWPPGYRIPFETEMAEHYGVSRMTVNKALGQLTRDGLLERRRKLGTLVAAPRMQTAVMAIANIGEEIRQNGHAYGYTVVKLERRAASAEEHRRLKLRSGEAAIVSIESLHLADGRPFCHESRLINADLVPEADLAELSREPAGAWLLRKVPWSSAEHAIRAINPPAAVARHLGVQPSTACLQIERFTEHNGLPVTFTRLIYPGDQHQLMASFAP